MNRVLRALLSLVLIAAGIFGLFTGINGVKDALNIKDYKEADAEHGKAQINDELLPGIQQLRENFDVYMDGVKTFEDGKVQLAKINNIEIQLPTEPAFDTYSLKEASGNDIKQVEQGNGKNQ